MCRSQRFPAEERPEDDQREAKTRRAPQHLKAKKQLLRQHLQGENAEEDPRKQRKKSSHRSLLRKRRRKKRRKRNSRAANQRYLITRSRHFPFKKKKKKNRAGLFATSQKNTTNPNGRATLAHPPSAQHTTVHLLSLSLSLSLFLPPLENKQTLKYCTCVCVCVCVYTGMHSCLYFEHKVRAYLLSGHVSLYWTKISSDAGFSFFFLAFNENFQMFTRSLDKGESTYFYCFSVCVFVKGGVSTLLLASRFFFFFVFFPVF
ncbi:hypothetical protein PHYPO_G00067360 [Pangasianodon hypophthalmus]|uniref:Uncharacterized protein n=1 Tax=Pangasianodon hypophthalmus TaxID=310915 RepID=A0A5N5LTG0_PANHP|nr:hypothetical protein PHYPO_G00067360 [Pangasianodon hypophthalmus]